MDRPELLSILIVSYNCARLLTDCLDSVFANPPSCAFEVILVDNGSTDGTLGAVSGKHPITIVPNDQNLGFAGGNMLAASVARGGLLLLLNPDTVVPEGSLDTLVAGLLGDRRRAVAGACLVDGDGAFGTAWGDFPTLGWTLAKMTPWNRLGLSVRSRSRMGSTCEGIEAITPVGWVSGAAFLIRRDVWDRLGGLDTGYFMYFEETDLCYRVHADGLQVVVVPGARIVHREGGTIGQYSARQRIWFAHGLIRYFARNSSQPVALAVRVWVGLVNGALWLASFPVGSISASVRRDRSRYGALVKIATGRPVTFGADGVPR